jgi:hypothetical protein
MKLVMLHGPPATGKYTVGCELAALTGFRLFHNHLVVDTLLSVFAFGTPAFIELRETMWRGVFARAAADRLPGLIFTFSPENTVRPEFVEWLFTELPRHGVTLHSVALTASETELERRMSASSRREFGKLTDLDLYRRLREAGAFKTPVIPRIDLAIDTALSDPAASARRIAEAIGIA